ncbi:MAG TPA: archaeosortase/exosortase family protein, partial [Aquabacterium sp.]|nr:archaeosortase/exosortase family protein [Aquabacterium sp.]
MTTSAPPAASLAEPIVDRSAATNPDWPWQVGAWLAGFAMMYIPLYINLAGTTWATDQQSHGPMIMMVCSWLLWQDRLAIFSTPRKPALVMGGVVLLVSLLAFVVGRSQGVIEVDALSQLGMLVAGLLLIQ